LLGLEEQACQAENAVERRPELVADGGEQPRLRLAGGLRPLQRLVERALALAELARGVGQPAEVLEELRVLVAEPLRLRYHPHLVEARRAPQSQRPGEQEER